jgi:hypothetical protein
MIWSTFLITTVTLTVTLADLSLPNNEKTPASARVLTIVCGGERVRLAKLLYFTLKYSKSLYKRLIS